MRRVLRGIGRTLISIGVLILLFIAYELWGTGIAEARHQRALKHQFDASTSTTTPTTSPTSPTVGGSTTSEVPFVPEVPEGDAVAIIQIPKIHVHKYVVEGVSLADLKKGPGHYPHTPLPGEAGNAAIAGHRTTYGAPFYDLDALKPGDVILVTTRAGGPVPFKYVVDHSMEVQPTQTSVLDSSTDNRLTLTTCTPRYSAARRLVVVSKLVGREPLPAPTTVPTTTPPRTSARAPAAAATLSGESTSGAPAVAWGLVAGLVWLLTWAVSRRVRHRWLPYVVGTPVFLVVLFVFFENVSRLLPANM